MDLMNFADTFLKICGGISVIGGAGAIIWRCVSPAVKMKDRVERLEEIADPGLKDRIESLEDKADKDYKAILKLHELQAGMCQGIIAIMNHEIDGNHIEGLKKRRDDLIEMLTESC